MPHGFDAKFGHVAEEFERFRPDYPAELFEHILAAVPVDRLERAVDLGAGTGKSTRALLPHFREVVAVEPDLGMFAKLKQEVPAALALNLTAEECSQPLSSVDLVTVGNALHWMDVARVIDNVRSWLHPAGILAVYDRPLPRATPAVDAVVLAELRGPWKPYRDPRLRRELVWDETIRAVPGFEIVESSRLSYVVPMSPRDYTGFWRTTSYGSAYARSLTAPESYWKGLESRLREACGSEIISVDLSPPLILARKIP